MTDEKCIVEGTATIKETTAVFYNPAQTINRDLTLLVMNEHKGKVILDALSATGLRAIRYYKELSNVQVIANDVDTNAVASIKANLELNGIKELKYDFDLKKRLKVYGLEDKDISELIPEQSLESGIQVMQQDASYISGQFDIVDLDPYGTASPFIDNAVKNVRKGGLLCITCTDMQTLAGGKQPESNFMKYGGMASNSDFCHEHALRLVLKTVIDCANKYKKAVVPLLSISLDFYIRLFIRIDSSAVVAKDSCVNTGILYHCLRCKWFNSLPFGSKTTKNKYSATTVTIPSKCPECDNDLVLSGPLYFGPLHSKPFIANLLQEIDNTESKIALSTSKRLSGILSALHDEVDAPLYLRMKGLSKIFRLQMPKTIKIRNAIHNAGYKASPSHIGGDCIKTNMPISKVYDIYRSYFNSKSLQPQKDTLSDTLLKKPVDWQVSFEHHPDALITSKNARYIQTSNAPLSKPKKREIDQVDTIDTIDNEAKKSKL